MEEDCRGGLSPCLSRAVAWGACRRVRNHRRGRKGRGGRNCCSVAQAFLPVARRKVRGRDVPLCGTRRQECLRYQCGNHRRDVFATGENFCASHAPSRDGRLHATRSNLGICLFAHFPWKKLAKRLNLCVPVEFKSHMLRTFG